MDTSGEWSPDGIEATLGAAHALMRKGEGEAACRLLADATKRSISSEAAGDASLFSSVRGSYLVALGRDDEALDAYLEAEKLSNGEVYYQLTTARHMVTGVNEPKWALDKVDPLLAIAFDDPAVRQQARAIRGMALLSLDQPDAAIDELEAICEEFPVGLPAVSLDLTLVEVLAQAGVATEVCRRYLSLVESKAEKEGDAHVLTRLAKIRGLLPERD